MKRGSTFVLLVAGALLLGVAIGNASAATVDWKGVTWKELWGASATVNVDDELVITTSGSGYQAVHYNTPMAFRNAPTPVVQVSIDDPGYGRIQLWMEAEVYSPPAGAWCQIGAWEYQPNYQIYWWDYDTDLADNGLLDDSGGSWGWIDTGVTRSTGEHTFRMGMKDEVVYFYIDGLLVHMGSQITPNYFGDIYLGVRDPDDLGRTFTYTDYSTATDFDPISAQVLKFQAIEILGTVSDDKKLDKAVESIEKSLESERWTDVDHLDPKLGKKVFDGQKKAVKELTKLIEADGTPPEVVEACQAAIDKLIEADMMLAEIAHEEALAYAGDPKVDKELAKCERELEKAYEDVADDEYDKAIGHFKKAWERAQKALRLGG